MADERLTRVLCPKCNHFVTRVGGADARVEANCTRCQVIVVVTKTQGSISITTIDRIRQQA